MLTMMEVGTDGEMEVALVRALGKSTNEKDAVNITRRREQELNFGQYHSLRTPELIRVPFMVWN